ncbi:UbiH/UbiF/VisC/COQ6 family ubiquinone biosynthesis hydroxylase [Pandoraea nosoerga]|uniref:2-octaprenyl-6-methoxyphenol hydroxylase n=1 Tax=Pandoraea nosoerga TaxID=2508296 RepID=A0A5E4TAN1_9BURK|nr:UbiH/UbiF/VisC/COQ6 family ubiquinone biosynthesis hydroxylase [Pandoraea nosoerga]MBN4664156.1 UbiH/UbiF/VisC/COQ6 family ubiquinone biosynthesis hydroxylase [Pandoraea nosoerga]MBN4675435.1 UbiH/UbiF/VisC/COQ6 family ubiquinone biosynthesis hydroxylase [Pandoraea nosoerga]MBN4679243.1 UbiH/UbiF/VisC/COQ6 family ubiquinone biosynthesis hydroxylase [Pandoraea nosoerga]MBN4743759.1 UbiH/UbiF/VisC/COQ6 family ubiquinone biosynthesis hydroxylase [Pandoraea nosoerga]VVD85286.1 2-octaprenyl-6-me
MIGTQPPDASIAPRVDEAGAAPAAPLAPGRRFDLAIVGAGPVGTTLALLLAQRAPQLRVALVDARGPQTGYDDPRTLALSHGSREILARAGAWPQANGLESTPIRHIHVSQARRFGSTEIDVAEHGVPALGYVVRYGALMRALDAAMARVTTRFEHTPSAPASVPDSPAGLHHFRPYRAIALRQDAHGVTLTLGTSSDDHAQTLQAALAINAEGGLFESQATRLRARDYGQTALVAFVTCERPRPGWAWERFTPEGPLALLPQEHGYALVWCCTHAQARRRRELGDVALLDELHAAFGDRMGRFTSISARASFPLGLNALGNIVDGRVCAIGNAAQTLHPVAGQGLNLGLRDAFDLADTLVRHARAMAPSAARTAIDATAPTRAAGVPGPAALAAFARRRRADRGLTIRITDLLPRVFGIDATPVALLRGVALAGLDLVPPLKTAFARQMMFGQRG